MGMAVARGLVVLSMIWAAMPAAAQDAQACRENFDSCETACAVGALAGALASRGKVDGNRQNAECAARCEVDRQACLGNRAPAPQQNPVQAPQPAPSPYGTGVGVQGQGASGMGAAEVPAAPQSNQHDPAGVANHCIRANTDDSYGGFTNTCNFAVSYLHCFYRPQQDRHDTSFFNCERPGGLWAKSTTAGNLRPGQRNGTGIPIGGRIFVIACREPYGIRNASFDGTTLRASCVASGGASPSQTTSYSPPPPSAPAPAAPRPQPQAPAGEDMAHCMRLERSSSGGTSLANHCGVTVEATWCTEGGTAGDDCSRGFRNQWSIGAGRSYPVQGRPTRVRWGACRGANNLRGTGELLKYRCVG